MQYKINPNDGWSERPTKRVWDVIAIDEHGGYLGRICKFNTEQQARDYIHVQENIKIECKRADANKRDFLVFINGEHRAIFAKRTYSTGYLFKAADGADISSEVYRGGSRITQADFELVVRSAIAAGAVPTLAQLERSQLIRDAEKDNRAWDEAKSNHAARVRGEVLRSALHLYLNADYDDEHKAKAQSMLDGLNNGSGWL